MYHNSVAVLAVSKEPNPTVFQKTLASTTSTSACPDFDFPMGNIQMVGKSLGQMYKGEKPTARRAGADVTWTISPSTPWTSGCHGGPAYDPTTA